MFPVANAGTPNYDIIVYGADPEGIAAAVSAARNGASTLLIEPHSRLGGLFTLGEMNILDLSKDIHGVYTSAGIFREWHQMVGGGQVFEIHDAEQAFRQLIQREPNITLLLNSKIIKAIKQGDMLESVVVRHAGRDETFQAKRFIDATPDADLSVMSGVPYFLGQADMGTPGRFMAVTMMMHFSHVNWDGIRHTAKSHKFGRAIVRSTYAYGFSGILRSYHPQQANTMVRGLNIARMKDQSVYINALQLFGVNGLDDHSKAEAIIRGERETQSFLKFLRKQFPGFEHVQIAGYPQELYIRETRHIRSLYQLPITDLWKNKDQWDSIGIASYAVDMQATAPGETGHVVVQPKQYAIPFRSLIPLKANNLLVVGRSSGFTSQAAGSARVVPTGMVCGEAAGAAAAMSITLSESFPSLSKNVNNVELLQRQLQKQGALLYHFRMNYPYERAWYLKAILTLLPYGVISTDYSDHLDFPKIMKAKTFEKLLAEVVLKYHPDTYYRLARHLDLWSAAMQTSTSQTITRDQAIEIEERFSGLKTISNPWQEAVHAGEVDPSLRLRLRDNHKLTGEEGYALVADYLQYLQLQKSGH